MRKTLRHALLLALIAVGPAAARAETGQFTVSFGGLRAGILAYDGTGSGGRYKVAGSARPSGLAGAFFSARVDSAAQGRNTENTFAPEVAREITRDGDTTVERVFRYAGGVPQITRTPPRSKPQRHAAPAAAQKGTVDTTTAAFAILRDRPEALACKLDIAIFDGARRHRIQFNDAQKTASGLRCGGTYTRVAGFSPEEMAEQVTWPLQMDYVRQPDGTMRVAELRFRTSFGSARIRRR
ncbi:MAG: DUF3108 domain-containing protein [Rhodobacteraceae bacterium]|nr:DUF3108 domain-containing protein [Paracoccaceae bacterium]